MSTPAEELDALEALYNQGLISLKDFEAQKVTITQKINELTGYEKKQQPQQPQGFWATYFGAWKKIFNFSARTNRTQYFLFISFPWIIAAIVYLAYDRFMGKCFLNPVGPVQQGKTVCFTILHIFDYLFLFITGLLWLTTCVATFQRLRDTNRSGIIVVFATIAILIANFVGYIHSLTEAVIFSFFIIPISIYIFALTFLKGSAFKNSCGEVPTTSKKYVSYCAGVFFMLAFVLFCIRFLNHYLIYYELLKYTILLKL